MNPHFKSGSSVLLQAVSGASRADACGALPGRGATADGSRGFQPTDHGMLDLPRRGATLETGGCPVAANGLMRRSATRDFVGAPDRGLKPTATLTKSLRDLKSHVGFRLIRLLSLLLLSCGLCAADQRPEQIRVSFQYIEVAHSFLTEILAAKDKSGAAMHAMALAQAKDGKAKILETCMAVCRSGQKAKVGSFSELIYPVEYEPSGLGGQVGYKLVFPCPVIRSFPCFETRNTGVTFEVEPTVGPNGHVVELYFVPEIISLLRFDTMMEHKDPWGNATWRMPVFESWRVNTSVTLTDGQFEMVSVITPRSTAPAVPRKILVFVRADVIPHPSR